MRVVVTGGAGRLGQLTINELLDHGHEVVSIDKAPISARAALSGDRSTPGARSCPGL